MTKTTTPTPEGKFLEIAVRIVAGYVSHNLVAADDLPKLIVDTHAAVMALVNGDHTHRGNQQPAVPIDKSITHQHVICLEDGKQLKMLKRYLRTHYDLTPDEYRRKWGLPADYPMTAPAYSKRRSKFAKDIGLGTVKTTPRKRSPKNK